MIDNETYLEEVMRQRYGQLSLANLVYQVHRGKLDGMEVPGAGRGRQVSDPQGCLLGAEEQGWIVLPPCDPFPLWCRNAEIASRSRHPRGSPRIPRIPPLKTFPTPVAGDGSQPTRRSLGHLGALGFFCAGGETLLCFQTASVAIY